MSGYHLLLADVRVFIFSGARAWEVGDVAAQFICHSWAATPYLFSTLRCDKCFSVSRMNMDIKEDTRDVNDPTLINRLFV